MRCRAGRRSTAQAPAACRPGHARGSWGCPEAGNFVLNNITNIMTTSNHDKRPWSRVLLLIPYIALLWVPFYNDVKPSFLGFPFFYWYQLLWVPLTSLLLFIAYRGIK
jgi:hypothetical protein